jgi:uncharacterized protein YacL
MLLGHLLCGLIVGWLAALASFLMELPLVTMLGVYVLGANIGILLSVLLSSVVLGAGALITRWPSRGAQAR